MFSTSRVVRKQESKMTPVCRCRSLARSVLYLLPAEYSSSFQVALHFPFISPLLLLLLFCNRKPETTFHFLFPFFLPFQIVTFLKN